MTLGEWLLAFAIGFCFGALARELMMPDGTFDKEKGK